MMLHYLKSAIRNLVKNKVFTAINILGLAVSFSVAMASYLIVDYHFSFDNFHEDKDRIFRVVTTTHLAGDKFPNPGVPVPLSEIIESGFSGIETSAFFHIFWSVKVTVLETEIYEKIIQEGNSERIFTNSKYFNLFQYDWLAGKKESLNEPFNQVLTEELAIKYFGEVPYDSIIGKEIIYDNSPPIKVSGIVKGLKQPTELIFQAFISLPTLETSHFDFYKEWDGVNSNNQLLIKIDKGILPKNIEGQIHELEKNYSNADETGQRTYELQPIEDIHFNGKYGNFKRPMAYKPTPHKPTLYVLMIVTFLLLLLSCVNFINLTTAMTSARSKEFSIRKTLGGLKFQLNLQLILETFGVVLTGLIVAFSILPFAFQVFSDFIPNEISPAGIWEWKSLILLGTLIILVTLISGISGSFAISSIAKFQRVNLARNLLRQENRMTKYKSYLVLTILQFSVSILIITALSTKKQILFSINKDLGYQTEATITFSAPPDKKELLLSKISAIPKAQSVSLEEPPLAPGSTYARTFAFECDNEKSEIHTDIKDGDLNFITLYENFQSYHFY